MNQLSSIQTFFSNCSKSFFVFSSLSLSFAASAPLTFSLAISSFFLFLVSEKINKQIN